MNFLRGHRFRLDDCLRLAVPRQIDNVIARFFAVRGPEDVTAAVLNFLFEFEQVAVEMIDRFPLYLMAFLARRLPILKSRATAANRGVVLINVVANYLAVSLIGRLYRSFS